MGWDYTQGATKKDIIARLIKSWDHRQGNRETVTLKHCVRGNVLWALHENHDKETHLNPERWIGCYLLGSHKGYGWGYKGMEESMGPYYYSCPLSYLDECPPPDNEYSTEWREKVRAHHSQTNIKLTVGQKVTFRPGLTIRNISLSTGTVTKLRPLIINAHGFGQVRASKRHIIAPS